MRILGEVVEGQGDYNSMEVINEVYVVMFLLVYLATSLARGIT